MTGATEGIGLATANQLCREGHTVLVHGRAPDKVARVVGSLRQLGDAHGYVADLSVLADVRRLGAEVGVAWPKLDGLLNNAGSFDGDYTGSRLLTPDGNEYTLAVNVLAPFLLTSLLLPSLRASGRGRCVIASSVSMGASDALDDLQLERGYSGHRAYSLSKLCDAMISRELHERYGDPPALAFNSMDPTAECGMGCDTKMLRAGWGAWGAPPAKSTISARMLTRAEWGGRSGDGFGSRREVCDPGMRGALWRRCVELTGAQYPDK